MKNCIDIPLEAQFTLEQFVKSIAVLATTRVSDKLSKNHTLWNHRRVAVVDLIVRAHDRAGTSTDSICKGPEV